MTEIECMRPVDMTADDPDRWQFCGHPVGHDGDCGAAPADDCGEACPSPTCPPEHASWWRTLDGVKIVDGLRVWDYDLRRVRVDLVDPLSRHEPADEFHQHWNGWFSMRSVEGGGRTASMNGSRMWVRHPSTGEEA